MSIIFIVFVSVIVVGVVYNNVCIVLVECGWELVSLWVLGFMCVEVLIMLLGEMVIMIVLVFLLGMVLGWVLIYVILELFKFDQFFFLVVICVCIYVWVVLCVVVVGIVSGVVVCWYIDWLDMVVVFKMRE